MVSYCDHCMSVVGCAKSVVNNCLKRISSQLTKLGRNDPYMAFLNNCPNGSDLLHI